MKLFLHKNLKHRQELIKCVFDVCKRELGLEGATENVRVHAANCEGGAGDTGNWLENDTAMVRVDHRHVNNDDELVQVLCHEFVHVKQLVKDKLRAVSKLPFIEALRHGGFGIMYQGKHYPEGNNPLSRLGGLNRVPWEAEAYGKDRDLVEKVSDEWAKRHPGARRFKPVAAFHHPDCVINHPNMPDRLRELLIEEFG